MPRFLTYSLTFVVLFTNVLIGYASNEIGLQAANPLNKFIKSLSVDSLGDQKVDVAVSMMHRNVAKVLIEITVTDTIQQDDWKVELTPSFTPTFHWAPHLTPTDDHIIAQHVFRAPALIMADKSRQVTIIPDLSLLNDHKGPDWYMDLNATENKLILGMSESAVKEHVLFVREEGAEYKSGTIKFGFYILLNDDKKALFNPWEQGLDFLWETWGQGAYDQTDKLNLDPYVDDTYNWAFNSWKGSVWQEFTLNGKKVGAPTFIVNVTQSPNYEGLIKEREFRSIWNQAWFNSLRSAQGVFRYARRTRNKELMDYAQLTKELALAFPQKNGFFYGLIATEMENVEIDGNHYNRSKDWDAFYWGNSNRNPLTRDARNAPFHILDMSYTAWLMLNWYDELEQDSRLLDYAIAYADALVGLQDSDGFFPAWLALEDLQPYSFLAQSPETSMSVTFLVKLYQISRDERYLDAAVGAMDAVVDNVVMDGRWEDFETYWSCSTYGQEHLVGKKVERNNMYKQNTLSMYWTAQALLNMYQVTGEKDYLRYGNRTLDELLMAQAVWQPPFIYVDAFGGFGVMNADAEWNDSRQSLFAELIIQYGLELGKRQYIQRGLAALRASFLMMYSPYNEKTKQQWEARWPFFGEEDYGFMMENYGHGGVTDDHGLGIGEFTIYDWGNGAAAEAYNRLVDHYGKDFMLNN